MAVGSKEFEGDNWHHVGQNDERTGLCMVNLMKIWSSNDGVGLCTLAVRGFSKVRVYWPGA